MTGSPTIIQQPGALDIFRESFMQSLAEAQRLRTQREQLQIEREKAQSLVDLQGAEATESRMRGQKMLKDLERQDEEHRAQVEGLSIVQGNMQDLTNPERFGQVFTQIKDPLVAQSVLSYRDTFLDQQKAAAALADQAAAKSALSQAISSISSPEQRQQFQQFAAIEQGGVPIPQAVTQAVFPALVPPPQVDPSLRIQALNGMREAMARGATLGEARRIYGLGPFAVSDDYKFPAGAVNQRVTQQATKNAALQTVMETTLPIIQATTEQTGGLSLPTAFYAQIRKVGYQAALNEITDPSQRQLLNATRRFVDAQRYFLSGQQTSDQEFANQLSYTAIFSGDDEQTKGQKLASMYAMVDAIRATTVGVATPSSAIQRVIETGQRGNWNANLMRHLRQQLRDAQRWEQTVSKTGPIPVGDVPADSADWNDYIRNNIP